MLLCFSVQGGRILARAGSAGSAIWINRHAEVWNESIRYPREMETGSKERDRGGEGKSLACGPILERGISFGASSRTGCKKLAHFENGVSIVGECFLERGANLDTRAAHTHPKNTQVKWKLFYDAKTMFNSTL